MVRILIRVAIQLLRIILSDDDHDNGSNNFPVI